MNGQERTLIFSWNGFLIAGLIDNDEKVALSEKHGNISNSRLKCILEKTIPSLRPK